MQIFAHNGNPPLDKLIAAIANSDTHSQYLLNYKHVLEKLGMFRNYYFSMWNILKIFYFYLFTNNMHCFQNSGSLAFQQKS